jgi:hypothetical protein
MNLALASVRTFVALSCAAGLVGCVDGDDNHPPSSNDTKPPYLRNFKLVYEGQTLSWRPAEGAYQGLSGAVDEDVFQIDATLLQFDKGSSGILKDEGFAGILWSAPSGDISKGEHTCANGEVVIAVKFPHLGNLVTHSDEVQGGKPAMAKPITEGVACTINVTRADKVGGFVEGTLDATLAYVPFRVAPSPADAVELKRLTGSFKLTRAADVTED